MSLKIHSVVDIIKQPIENFHYKSTSELRKFSIDEISNVLSDMYKTQTKDRTKEQNLLISRLRNYIQKHKVLAPQIKRKYTKRNVPERSVQSVLSEDEQTLECERQELGIWKKIQFINASLPQHLQYDRYDEGDGTFSYADSEEHDIWGRRNCV